MLLNQNSDFHNAQINTVIDSKKSISELIPILHAINMDPDVLKNVIKQTVNQFDSSVCRRVFYSLLNIEQILPEDVIQKIESFNHSLSMKSVSKTFKRCFTKNENIKLKEREVEIATELNITENNQTWVIEADHDATSALDDALNQAMSGDTILMHDGTYILNDDHEFNKDIQLVGIGDNVIIEFPQNEFLHSVCCKLYLKNLKLYMPYCADGIQVEQGSSLWMEKCVIHNSFYGVAVGGNANLCAANCIFEGPSDYQAIDIQNSTNTSLTSLLRRRRRNISILNCRFTDCGSKSGESCITIPECGYWSLTIIGNSFKNMKGFPIGLNMADMADSHDHKIYPICPYIEKNSAIFRLNQLSFKDEGLFRYLR